MKKKGVRMYSAGINLDDEGNPVAGGGRLAYFVGEGRDIDEARGRVYGAISYIFIPGEDGNQAIFRNDVGWRDTKRLREAGY
jgi:phosphoribosylamine--glycine ligase